jgi:hypothetical protein
MAIPAATSVYAQDTAQVASKAAVKASERKAVKAAAKRVRLQQTATRAIVQKGAFC